MTSSSSTSCWPRSPRRMRAPALALRVHPGRRHVEPRRRHALHRGAARPRLPSLARRLRQRPLLVHVPEELPVDFLKIDGQFMHNVTHDRIDRSMVEAIAQIGETMGIRTIAERVDSAEVLARLADIGFQYAQGHYIGGAAAGRGARFAGVDRHDASQPMSLLPLWNHPMIPSPMH